MKTKKKLTNHNRRATARNRSADSLSQPFIEHALELRRRIYYITASVLVWGAATYAVQQHVVSFLLRPAHGQHFIYTSPGGGIDFLFRICIYSGLVFSLPVIVYNVLRFFEPLLSRSSRRFTALGSLVSGILALAGVIFGYYVGLPAALRFLLHQFTTVQIQPLVTIQSYLGFVIVYMVGSAMLFQLPLLLIFINRIKPLKPRKLLKYERWVILVAFVLAGLMNPTPNVISQLLVAGPFILMYQVGILMITLINRPKRSRQARPASSPAVDQLFERDRLVQAQRQQPALQPIARSLEPAAVVQLPAAARTPRPVSRPHFVPEVYQTHQSVDGISRGVIQPTARLSLSRRMALASGPRFMEFVPPNSQALAPKS